MQSARNGSRGWPVESGSWEGLVAIVLGLLLTVALGRIASGALAAMMPAGERGVSAVAVSPSVPH